MNTLKEGEASIPRQTHTTRPKLAVHRQGTLVPRQGPGGGEPRARQAASGQLTLGTGQTGQGWGSAPRYEEHGTLWRRDQDQQTQPQGPRRTADARPAYELKLETGP